MPKKTEHILVISNTAERTGAPLLLLNLLKWIRKNSSLQFVFILQNGGELLTDYENIGTVYLWNKVHRPLQRVTSLTEVCRKMRNKFKSSNRSWYTEQFIGRLTYDYNINLVILNTVTNGQILQYVKDATSASVITYVHEGKRLLEVNNTSGLVGYSLDASNRIIAVSNVVSKVLAQKYQQFSDIEIIPGAIDISINPVTAQSVILKKSLIPANVKVVMACGYPEWHKGTDLFIQVAKKVVASEIPIHFIWLGGEENCEGFLQMHYDIEKLNLQNFITLVSNKKNVYDYINFCDVLIVLSRDESFSLVTIEAGFLSKPVLFFDGTGGPCEIVDYDSRFIVPYASIDEMSNRIVTLLKNKSEAKEMGDYLHNKVISHYSLENSAGKLLNVINDLISV